MFVRFLIASQRRNIKEKMRKNLSAGKVKTISVDTCHVHFMILITFHNSCTFYDHCFIYSVFLLSLNICKIVLPAYFDIILHYRCYLKTKPCMMCISSKGKRQTMETSKTRHKIFSKRMLKYFLVLLSNLSGILKRKRLFFTKCLSAGKFRRILFETCHGNFVILIIFYKLLHFS